MNRLLTAMLIGFGYGFSLSRIWVVLGNKTDNNHDRELHEDLLRELKFYVPIIESLLPDCDTSLAHRAIVRAEREK